MNKLKITGAVLTVLLCAANASAQQKMDIGFHISNAENERVKIEFRKPLNDKYRLNIGGSYGKHSNRWGAHLIESNADYDLFRTRHYATNSINLRIGAERKLGASMFSVGTNLVAGYQTVRYNGYNLYEEKLEDGKLVYGIGIPQEEYYYTPTISTETTILKRHKIRLGIQSVLSTDIPLGKRFLVNVYAGLYGGVALEVDHDIILDNRGELTTYFPVSLFEVEAQYGVGLRYVLGGNQ